VDYLLLLAWNFKAEMARRARAAGFKGRFILPVPSAEIWDPEEAGAAPAGGESHVR
jgi:hypothetical protein